MTGPTRIDSPLHGRPKVADNYNMDYLVGAYKAGRKSRNESWSHVNPYSQWPHLALSWESGWQDVNTERMSKLNPKRGG